MNKIISRDGTGIAYEKIGAGPALILVDGALCYRSFGPMPKLAPLLAKHFTVYYYDRRGRGDSGDVQPFAAEKEVDDIAALITEAGGSAFLAGLSSGAALVLRAAAAGLNIPKAAAYEPPYVYEPGSPKSRIDHGSQLRGLLNEGKRGAAVRYFMVSMVGMPAVIGYVMSLMPMFKKLKAVAHTLPYDTAVMGNFTPPVEQMEKIKTRILIAGGEKSPDPLKNAVRSVAGALKNGELQWLEKQTHNVDPKVLASALTAFFTQH